MSQSGTNLNSARRIILSISAPLLAWTLSKDLDSEFRTMIGGVYEIRVRDLSLHPAYWPTLIVLITVWLWFLWGPSSRVDSKGD